MNSMSKMERAGERPTTQDAAVRRLVWQKPQVRRVPAGASEHLVSSHPDGGVTTS